MICDFTVDVVVGSVVVGVVVVGVVVGSDESLKKAVLGVGAGVRELT